MDFAGILCKVSLCNVIKVDRLVRQFIVKQSSLNKLVKFLDMQATAQLPLRHWKRWKQSSNARTLFTRHLHRLPSVTLLYGSGIARRRCALLGHGYEIRILVALRSVVAPGAKRITIFEIYFKNIFICYRACNFVLHLTDISLLDIFESL